MNPGSFLDISHMQAYGCWCYFDELFGTAKGYPINEYDAICQKYNQAVTCAMREISNCDPRSQNYTVDIMGIPNCSFSNPIDECAQATCYIETFIVALIKEQHMMFQNRPDYEMNSVEHGFDNSECGGPVTNREHTSTCCGEYKSNTKRPVRIYPTDVDKQCCDDSVTGDFKVYDASVMLCCDDGSVKTVCD